VPGAANGEARNQVCQRFEGPDRVTISHPLLPPARIKYGRFLDEVLTEFREDSGWVDMPDLPVADFAVVYKQGRNADDFGTVWAPMAGVCGSPVDRFLRDLNRYEEFEWPDLRFGPTSQAREGVHRTFEACGVSRGGIVACGEVGPDVPLEKIRAMYEAFREFGRSAARTVLG